MNKDNNEILTVDRAYVQEDLANIESDLLNKNGELDDDVFDEIPDEIIKGLYGYLSDCYEKVENSVLREKRNVKAEKKNAHFLVYLKNENAYQNEYKKLRAYTNLSDAEDYIHNGSLGNPDDHYEIRLVKDDQETVIKNYVL